MGGGKGVVPRGDGAYDSERLFQGCSCEVGLRPSSWSIVSPCSAVRHAGIEAQHARARVGSCFGSSWSVAPMSSVSSAANSSMSRSTRSASHQQQALALRQQEQAPWAIECLPRRPTARSMSSASPSATHWPAARRWQKLPSSKVLAGRHQHPFAVDQHALRLAVKEWMDLSHDVHQCGLPIEVGLRSSAGWR